MIAIAGGGCVVARQTTSFYEPSASKEPRTKAIVTTEDGRKVMASVTVASLLSGEKISVRRRHRRGPALDPQRRAALKRLKAEDVAEAKYQQVGDALYVVATRKVMGLGRWHKMKHGFWRVRGWWKSKACPRCKKRRYVWPVMGLQRKVLREGRWVIRSIQWPPPYKGLVGMMLGPDPAKRPHKECRCPTRP